MPDDSALISALSRLTAAVSAMEGRMAYESRTTGGSSAAQAFGRGGGTLSPMGIASAISPEFGSLAPVAAMAMASAGGLPSFTSPMRANPSVNSYNWQQSLSAQGSAYQLYSQGIGNAIEAYGLPNNPTTQMVAQMGRQFAPELFDMLTKNVPGNWGQNGSMRLAMAHSISNGGHYVPTGAIELGNRLQAFSNANPGYSNLGPEITSAATFRYAQMGGKFDDAGVRRTMDLGRNIKAVADAIDLDVDTAAGLFTRTTKNEAIANAAINARARIDAVGGANTQGLVDALSGTMGSIAAKEYAGRYGGVGGNLTGREQGLFLSRAARAAGAAEYSREMQLYANVRAYGSARDVAELEDAMSDPSGRAGKAYIDRMKGSRYWTYASPEALEAAQAGMGDIERIGMAKAGALNSAEHLPGGIGGVIRSATQQQLALIATGKYGSVFNANQVEAIKNDPRLAGAIRHAVAWLPTHNDAATAANAATIRQMNKSDSASGVAANEIRDGFMEAIKKLIHEGNFEKIFSSFMTAITATKQTPLMPNAQATTATIPRR